jgi:hypothetical protein
MVKRGRFGDGMDSSERFAIASVLCETKIILILAATLFYQSHIGIDGRKVAVCYRKTVCDECDCVLEYDGGSDSVLNLNNSTLVHYSELFAFLIVNCADHQSLF